jgi:ubiquinone/menaquinone biosynthesis C-methylase UbiE
MVKEEDFSLVTETPEAKITVEQLERMYSRYYFALDYCKEKDVLEIACGAGQGLGLLAKKARKVVGSDISQQNLGYAKSKYSGVRNIEFRQFDAHNLPFEDKAFDTVIIYEAIYYLKDPDKFIKEAIRVLRKGGSLIICSVNKDWADFNPSPYSFVYFSVPELVSILKKHGFSKIDIFGNFLVKTDSAKDKLVSFIKRTAVNLHIMPKTMKGKELLKRLFIGKLISMPGEIREGQVEYVSPVRIANDVSSSDYKVIFAVGRIE